MKENQSANYIEITQIQIWFNIICKVSNELSIDKIQILMKVKSAKADDCSFVTLYLFLNLRGILLLFDKLFLENRLNY